MKYNFLQNVNAETKKWNRGICFSRSYFVPFSSVKLCSASDPLREVSSSDRAFSLGGEWDFYLDDGSTSSFDSDTCAWSKTTVPSFWKLDDGSTDPFLTKKKVRKRTQKAIYRTFFSVYDPGNSHFLNFTRVGGTFEVYVNGEFCGYSMTGEGEFDVTTQIRQDQNELIVVVQAFSRSDLFFTNGQKVCGICGDVVHTVHPVVSLVDYAFDSYFDSIAYVGKLSLAFIGDAEFRTRITLCDKDKVLDKKETSGKEQVIEFRDLFQPYSPDSPYLYNVYVQIFVGDKEIECSRFRVGFYDRKIDGEYKYCGMPMKIMSTEYRDIFLPDGRVMNREDYVSELTVLKKNNFNAVVTSVPMEPEFIRICNELGVWVIEGFGFDLGSLPKKGKRLRDKFFEESDAESFVKEVCISRAMRDRSAPCVIGFSFGPCSQEKCFRNIADSFNLATRFILFSAPCNGCVSLASPASADEASTLAQSSTEGVFFQLPGSVSQDLLSEYVGLSERSEHVFGYCVGEMRDIVCGEKSFGTGIFTVGLQPKPIAVHAKYLLRKPRASIRENSFLDIKNTSYFRSLVAMVVVRLHSGEVVNELRRFKIDIPANSVYTYDLKLGKLDFVKELEIAYYDAADENEHLISEIIPVFDDPALKVDIGSLACKNYVYSPVPFDKTAEENTVPSRSRFSPCSTEEVCDGVDANAAFGCKSDRTLSLSGPWQFRYYGDKLPSAVSSEGDWDVVSVPGTWEEAGCEGSFFRDGYAFSYQQKKNKFEFDKNNRNTMAVYRKTINIADLSFRHFLYFESLSGAIQLYVNGEYVGCSSYRSAEFEISERLNIGENEIIVIMQKWSRNSFIYAEDGLTATGILGDVVLIKSHKKGLYDCQIKTHAVGKTFFGDVTAHFSDVGGKVILKVKNGRKLIFEETKDVTDRTLQFHCGGEWKPYFDESPQLYDFYLTVLVGEKIVECTKIRTAMTDLVMENGVNYLNYAPLKLRGVVYNPVYSRIGRLMTADDYKKDLDLLKRYGFNAVQPSFLPTESFLRICLEKGLYVMCRIPVKDGDTLSDDKHKIGVWYSDEFAERVGVQTEREYKRTSLYNNVLGYIFTQEPTYPAIASGIALLRGLTDKPVFANGNTESGLGMDRPTLQKFTDKIDAAMGKEPILLLGYASSYGIGCPDLERFEENISGRSCCMGGFIARFVDEIMEDKGERDDGLFTADRIPCCGAENAKFLYRKVKGRVVSESQIEIENSYDYIDTSDFLIKVCVLKNGLTLSRTELVATVPPRQKRIFDIFIDHIEGDMFINLEFYRRSDGELLYVEQHRLSEAPVRIHPKNEDKLRVDEFPDYLDITFNGGKMRFDKTLGAFTHYSVMGKEVLKPGRLEKGGNCFIGNIDRPFIRHLTKDDKCQYQQSLRDFSWQRSEDGTYADILVETSLNLKNKECFVIRDKYLVGANGRIEVFSVINTMKRHLDNIDCFGKKLRLHNAFGNVSYYGLGERDNYVDMCGCSRMGVFSFGVDKVFESVNVKQECGNRMNVHYVLLRDKDGDGIMCVAEKDPFQMRVSPYSDEEIKRAFKGEKISQSGVYVDIDSVVGGYGSDCGEPAKKYTYLPGEYLLHFSILPVFADRNK